MAADPAALTLALSVQSSLASAADLIMSVFALTGARFEDMVAVSVAAVTLALVLVAVTTNVGGLVGARPAAKSAKKTR